MEQNLNNANNLNKNNYNNEKNNTSTNNDNNNSDKSSNTLLECVICLTSPAEDPVVVQCGHIFCWECLKKWIYTSNQMFCPICKNGINIDKAISLYVNSTNKHKDKPKQERVAPIENRNRPGFIRTIFQSIYHSSIANDDVQIPLTRNEVKANRLALLMVIIFVIIFILILQG